MFLSLSPFAHDPLFRSFDDLLSEADTLLRAPRSSNTASTRVNGYRTDDAYVLVLEAPGLTAEQLDIKVEDQALHLTGTTVMAAPTDARVIHRELPDHLSLSRRFTFADDADLTKTTAELKNGLLKLRVPRVTPVVHRVNVKTA